MTPPAQEENVLYRKVSSICLHESTKYKRRPQSETSSHNSLNCFQKGNSELTKMKFVSFSLQFSLNFIIFQIAVVLYQILAVAFLAVALAAPQGDKKPIEMVSSNSKMNADGSYSFE
jgi:hypothetical protein